MRNCITEFSLANPIYTGATVNFYTVSAGVKTSTLATLYSTITGSETLVNPQQLDSDGKFKQAVYIGEPVIAAITGLTIPDHDTGIIQAVLSAGSLASVLTDYAASGGSALIGFTQAGTGAVSTTVQSKLREQVSVKDFGAFSTPSERTAALSAALAAHDAVFINSGTYDPIEISASNKTLFMDSGVEFRLPNGTVESSAVTGPAVFKVSGSNVTINGNFTVNGNRANNSSYSLPTSVRIASCYVTGNNVKFFGEVHVKDAYWVGFAAEYTADAVNHITGLYIHRLNVTDADYHSVMLWSVTNWRIDDVVATGGTPGTWLYGTKDQRIRLGTQLANTSKCKIGSIGSITSDRYITFTIENGAHDITVDVANTAAGGKIQNSSRCNVGVWSAFDTSVENQAYGLAIINVDSCSIGVAVVKNYDCDNAFIGYAFAIIGATDCTIGSVLVIDSLANAGVGCFDMIITTASNLHIGQVTLTSPDGTIGGFLFDYDVAYAPQQNITIDSIVSAGHTGYDVIVEATTPIKIGTLNSDAVEQYPNNRNNMAVVRESTWTPTISRAGSTVTYTTQIGNYSVIGKMVVAHFNIVVDTVSVQGTGYWAISLPITSRSAYPSQAGELSLRSPATTALGIYAPTGSALMYMVAAAGSDAYNGVLGTGALSGSIAYMID